MQNEHGLPIYSGPLDHLRTGFRSLESEMNSKHPCMDIQNGNFEWGNKLDMVRRTYGSHLAMRLASEKAMFSKSNRLPGLASSNIHLETLMGTDTTIEFTDFLNDPYHRPELPRIQLHAVMESKLGIL